MTIIEALSVELQQKQEYVENVVNLLDEGNTIPFIARYRKEMHGSMDDTTLRNLETRLQYLRNLQERRDEVKKSIENQGKLTEELAEYQESKSLEDIEERQRRFYKTEMEIHQMSLFDKMTDPGGNNGTDFSY